MKTGSELKMSLLLKQSLLATVIAWCVHILLLFVGTVFIQNEYIDIGAMVVLGFIVNFVAVFCGMLFSVKLGMRENVSGCLAAVVLYILAELCISMLFFDGANTGFVAGIVSTILGALLAITVGKKGNSRIRKGRKKTRTR